MTAAGREGGTGEPSEVMRDYVARNVRTWTAMQKVLDTGEHCPTHLRGSKPAAGRRP